MKHLVLDIETIPQDPSVLLARAPEFTAAANLKDPEKIAASIAKKKADYLADAALNWKTAEVVLIGAGEDDEIQSFMVIKGLWAVDKWLSKRSVTESPYREKLLAIGGKGLCHEIRREIAVIGQGGTRVAACAIAKYLNKQRLAAHLKIELN